MATDSLWAQSEVVRKKAFPYWLTKQFNVATDLIKRGEVENIGERDFRIPAETVPPGRVGQYNPQGGDQGRGTSSSGIVMIAPYFTLRLNFELDFLKIKANENQKLSVLNPFKEAMANGFREFQLYIDKFFHSDGTAVLATATAHAVSGGKSTYTLDNVYGAQRLRRGQYITVYNNALTTQLSASTLFIEAIDTNARTARLSGTVAGAGADDKITFEGVTGSSPAGLLGTEYFNSTATSGTTLGINRATEPEIIANGVNGSGGLTPEHGMSLYQKILLRRGEVANEVVGLSNVHQQAAVYANVMSIQMYDVTRSKELIDRLPALKGKKTFQFGDMTHYVDIHQNFTRLDYVIPSLWGRARLGGDEEGIKYFETPGSRARFFQLYGGSGAPANIMWFGLTCDENFYCINPGNQGVIHSLPVNFPIA